MLSEHAAHRADELRRLLDAGTLDEAGPIDVRPGCPLPALLAARIVLTDLAHLERAGILSPTRWGLVEELIEQVHRAVTR